MRLVRSSMVARTVTSAAAALLIRPSRCFSASTSSTITSSTAVSGAASSTVHVSDENWLAIEGLEPKALWKQFATLSSIPRPSKQEHAVLSYVKDEFCVQHHLEWKQDEVGNLVVFYPGTVGHQNAPPVVIQGHVDMVTEKNSDTVHDFTTDPIRLIQHSKTTSRAAKDERWLGAQGTTLGADNGIGVAAALALLETPIDSKSATLPPLQVLLTVDEETGLTGAQEVDVQRLGLTGKTMLNLDTEEWGELYVGCAGGGESALTLPLQRRPIENNNDNGQWVELRVGGLLGGHSGINIHEGRANAILLCAAATRTILLQEQGVQLVSMSGGDKHNAIPREARSHLWIPNEEARAAVQQVLNDCQRAAMEEYGTLESNLRFSLVESRDDDTASCESPLETDSANRLLSMLLSLPVGPLKFSHVMPDLVETSNNVASLVMNEDDDSATVLCSTRSSIATALEQIRDKVSAVASLAGAHVERTDPYPGWNPDMNSPILETAKRLLSQKLNGSTPGIKAIHAGLECGLLIEKMGGDLDAISFGPTITGAHSPDESINVDTVPPFFDLVQDILAELAEAKSS